MAEIVIKLVNGELAGKTMQGITKEVNAAATALKKAEIGTQAWVDANKKLDDTKKLQADLKKQIEGTTTASDMLKKAWNSLPGAQYFNQVADSFGLMKKGVGGLITQFGVLKTAIAATGIGVFVLLIGSLVAWFTKTEEGADKLKSVLYPLQVLFQKLTGILADLGGKVFKRLSEAFEDPVQAIKDLGNAILENVINRFKSLAVFGEGIMQLLQGNFKQGFKSLADATIQFTTGVTDATDKMNAVFTETANIWNEAYEQGQRLLELENAIEDAEAALVVTRAKLNVESSKAMELARDTAKSDEERLAAAREFQAIVNQQTAAEENFLKLKQQRLILEQDIDGILTDDEKLARAQMEADIIQLQADNIDKRKKARALELNLVEEIAKREADIAKNIAQLKAQAAQDGFDQEVAMVQQQTEEKILALQGSEAQILEQKMLLKEIEAQQLIAIGEKYQAINNANFQKAKDDEDKINKKALADREKIENAKQDLVEKTREVENEMAQQAAGFGTELLARQFKDEATAKRIRKAGAVVDIGLKLQQELAGISANAALNPLNAVPGGAAFVAAQAALQRLQARGRALFATATVLAFKRGGYVQGPSHGQGGVPGVVRSTGQPIEFEGGEFFFSRKAVQAIGVGTLTRINDKYTNRFESGGPVNPFPDRGPVSSGASAEFDYEKMAMIMDQMVDRKIRTIRVQNVVTETRDALNVVNEIEASADV